jgi:hypothetical protein
MGKLTLRPDRPLDHPANQPSIHMRPRVEALQPEPHSDDQHDEDD